VRKASVDKIRGPELMPQAGIAGRPKIDRDLWQHERFNGGTPFTRANHARHCDRDWQLHRLSFKPTVPIAACPARPQASPASRRTQISAFFGFRIPSMAPKLLSLTRLDTFPPTATILSDVALVTMSQCEA